MLLNKTTNVEINYLNHDSPSSFKITIDKAQRTIYLDPIDDY